MNKISKKGVYYKIEPALLKAVAELAKQYDIKKTKIVEDGIRDRIRYYTGKEYPNAGRKPD